MCPSGTLHNTHLVMAHIMNNAAAKPGPNRGGLDDVLATMYPMTPQERAHWIWMTSGLGMTLPKAASVLGPILRDEGQAELDDARARMKEFKMAVKMIRVDEKGGWEPPNGSEMKSNYDMAVGGEEWKEKWGEIWEEKGEEEGEEEEKEEEKEGEKEELREEEREKKEELREEEEEEEEKEEEKKGEEKEKEGEKEELREEKGEEEEEEEEEEERKGS
ncbi:hypothetical protein F4809DRAFT_45888 [Biscogniauxia mediterranea]|nr:hypothetical protein F4809DRAFT_45888 [Biscogniauxia mediterranea]